MTDYVAQVISKFNGRIYYVKVTGKNRIIVLEKLFEQYKRFNFNIFTKAEFWRYIYDNEFVYEKYDEDGSINEYHYIGWERLPPGVKAYYRLRAMKKVIELNELNEKF